jgi:hypothetical protein
MDWPVRFPAEMSAGTVSVRSYDPADAAELFEPLADERVWEHMSRAAPADAGALDEVIRSRLADGYRATFTIRQGGRVVGITSVLLILATRQARRSAARCSTRLCGGRASTRKSSGSCSR